MLNIGLLKAQNILAGFVENDIQKAVGEGARGGIIIGHTRSGKPIYANHNHPSHASFSKEDHYDASEAHDKIHDRFEKKYPKESKRPAEATKKMIHHAQQGRAHWDKSK